MLIHGAERGDVFVDGVVQTTTYLRSIVTCHLPTTILFSLGAQVSDRQPLLFTVATTAESLPQLQV